MVMMMMDLNEEESSPSVSAEKSAVDDSGPSISGEEGFRFGILKETDTSFLTTRQLFPTEIGAGSASSAMDFGRVNPQQPPKVRRGPRSRSSQYRGVTFYRRTGRWESHIWDCGKQVYLGGFDTADAAARVYDRAAIKFRGVEADINFTLSDYKEDLTQTRNLTKEEFVHLLRRHTTGFGRGASKYQGITRPQHKFGLSEARTGKLHGNKAYDNAGIKYDGREAVASSRPSYEREMFPEVATEDIGHDLDLNLRISQPNNTSQKRRDNPMGIQVPFSSFEQYSDAKKARINNASIAGGQPYGLLVASEPSQAWTALYSGLFPRTEIYTNAVKSSREKTVGGFTNISQLDTVN